MAKPGIAATRMFLFFFCWNDYYGPLLYTSENPSNWTSRSGWPRSGACTRCSGTSRWRRRCSSMLPVIVVFFFAQKAFVEGVTLTGVKG